MAYFKEVRKADNSVTGIYDTLQHDNDNYQYIEITEQEYNGIKANWLSTQETNDGTTVTVEERLEALEAAMLELILGGAV